MSLAGTGQPLGGSNRLTNWATSDSLGQLVVARKGVVLVYKAGIQQQRWINAGSATLRFSPTNAGEYGKCERGTDRKLITFFRMRSGWFRDLDREICHPFVLIAKDHGTVHYDDRLNRESALSHEVARKKPQDAHLRSGATGS